MLNNYTCVQKVTHQNTHSTPEACSHKETHRATMTCIYTLSHVYTNGKVWRTVSGSLLCGPVCLKGQHKVSKTDPLLTPSAKMNAPKRLRLLKCAFKNDIKLNYSSLKLKKNFFYLFYLIFISRPWPAFSEKCWWRSLKIVVFIARTSAHLITTPENHLEDFEQHDITSK